MVAVQGSIVSMVLKQVQKALQSCAFKYYSDGWQSGQALRPSAWDWSLLNSELTAQAQQ